LNKLNQTSLHSLSTAAAMKHNGLSLEQAVGKPIGE